MLVGLMLSLGGGANALTFKSDGSVVQKDGTTVKERRYLGSSRGPSTCSVLRNQNIPKYSRLYKDAFDKMVSQGLDCDLDKTTVASPQFGSGSNTLVSNAGEVQAVSGDELTKQQLASEVSDLLQQNAELLRKTEFYQLRVKFSFKNFKHKWSDNFDVIVSNEHLFGVKEHSKGKKFIFGKANDSNNFQNLRGYEYYEPNKNKAPISLKFSEKGLFIDSIVAGASIDGHVNWDGKWRTKVNGVPSYGASSVTNIKTKFEVSIRSPDVKTANLLLKELSRRRAILKSYSSAKKQMEEYFGSRGVFNAKFGDDLSHLVVELDGFYDEVLALVERHKEPETQMASANTGGPAQDKELQAKEAEARRLAKLEEERKAKEAEARRLVQLEHERKDKEAKALRLANLEEERKAKEAEAQRLAKLEEERKAKEAEAQRLAKLEEERKAKEAEARRLAEADKSPPQIFAEVVSQEGYDALVRGVVSDDTGLQDIAMNGQLLVVDDFGVFEGSVYIPRGGETLVIEAIDKMGKLSRFELKLERKQIATLQLATFEKLSPSNRRAKLNQKAVAVIIGIAEYQRTEVPAVFADQDAKFFYDYATLKLGVPEQNIIELVNDKANEIEIALAIENFLKRRIKRDVTDVYIFYAGHGLATDDGSEMYLLPYDGAPQLLERTAISRKQLFNDIAAANPRSVTVFLDTCYSGTTRGTETLIASRPIAIKAKQQDIPEGFTVMTAAAGDQTAKPLEEAKHGMFSYFLMKGMEGDADANQDNQITAGELHAYVQQNVIQQSSGSQTPELQGDADRVLVRFR